MFDMDLKTRYRILYFMIITATSPLHSCLGYYDGLKMRAQKIQEYGEKLSSIEDDAVLDEFGRSEKKFENISTSVYEEAKVYRRSNEGRDEPIEKSDELRESGNEMKLLGERHVTENAQEGTTIAFSTKCTTDKNIKVENDYKPDTSKAEDESKPDTSKGAGVSVENPSEEGEEGKEVSLAGGKPLKKDDSSEETVKVTKVYHPPKPTKLLDHYIDDV